MSKILISGTSANDLLTDDSTNRLDANGYSISGLAGNDVIEGSAFDDILNGGKGNDSLTGGTGDDVYVINSINDSVIELANEGIDTVKSSISVAKLAANVENLTLTGTAVQGNGNSLDNVITGNGSANFLQGDTGNDTIFGGNGNDTLAGNDGDDVIRGGNGDDNLNGGNGNDILIGGAGIDNISGGAGNDTIVLNSLIGYDNISNFEVANDVIQLAAAAFAGLTKLADNLAFGSQAADTNDYLIYDSKTGVLSYDADGNGDGAAVQIAIIGGHPVLTEANFTIG